VAANEVLRRELAAAGLTVTDVASKVGADPKTVSRWLADCDRLPHPEARATVAELVGVEVDVLWPSAVRKMVKSGHDREILAVYPTHSSVPDTVWQRLVGNARREIVFCDTVSYWYWYVMPELTRVLREKAQSGCRVRVILGEADDPAVAADEQATGVPLTLSSRIEQTRHLLEPLREAVEVRQSREGFGRSVYRGDDTAVAHWWVHGVMGTEFPAIHLRRREPGGLFDQVAVRHVDAVWGSSRPAW